MAYSLNQITLIGVGLIGGSFVLDLKRQQLIQQVVGIDLDHHNLERALERRVIDQAFNEINAKNINNADLILIATPVSTLPTICQSIQPYLSKHTIISDVGSTKQNAIAAYQTHLPNHLANCVATHPIAGSDRHGALAAQFGLYQNKKLIICPHQHQNPQALQTISELWQRIGAQIHIISAQEHDAIFAAVSHLPHLLAFAFINQIQQHPNGETYLQFAGSGFRDFTRIASSHPAIWTDIALANRNSLLELLQAQHQQINQLQTMLQNQDAAALYDYFSQAKYTRDKWQDEQ